MPASDDFVRGIFRENPIFGLLLGICPTLAVTTSLANGLAMGLAASSVLVCSNVIISLIRNFVPKEVRIPIFIVVIAGFVTMVDLVIQSIPGDISKNLGIFIPLIVVNCIILGRAEAFASRQGIVRSVLDGLGMGLGFTLSLLLISGIREVLGGGTLFGYKIHMEFKPASVLIMAPGAFLVLGLLLGLFNYRKFRKKHP